VLPVLIIAAVAVPVLVIVFLITRRSRNAGEHPVAETDAERQEIEREFADAERYQEEWRRKQHEHQPDPPR
jgi:hypothetical protein